MKNILLKIIKKIIYNFKLYIIDTIIYLLEDTITIVHGEDVWYKILDHLNEVKVFYGSLFYMLKNKILIIFEDILLEYTWKIKRSDNFLIKILKNYLSKYDWFNNNIINF